MDEQTPAKQPVAPTPENSGDDKKKETGLAVLAHALGIFTGFVGPLIIYLVEKDEGYVKNQAKEALNFQITVAIFWVASWFLAFIAIGFALLPIIGLGNLIFCIIAAMAVNKGEDYHYPFAIRLLK